MKFPALYRRYPESPIVETHYDIAAESVFDLKFPLPYSYVEKYAIDFNTADEYRLGELYNAIMTRKDVICVVLINGEYISMLYPTKVYTIRINDDKNEYTTSSGVYEDYLNYNNQEVIPVGFERTFCRVSTVLITPGRIYYNPSTNSLFFKNKWRKLKPGLVVEEYKKKDLFKILSYGEEGEGIIKTVDGHQII